MFYFKGCVRSGIDAVKQSLPAIKLNPQLLYLYLQRTEQQEILRQRAGQEREQTNQRGTVRCASLRFGATIYGEHPRLGNHRVYRGVAKIREG